MGRRFMYLASHRKCYRLLHFAARRRCYQTSCIANSVHSNGLFIKIARFSTKTTENCLNFGDIPSPKGLPFFGTTLSLILSGGASKLHLYADKRHAQLGPIFKESLGNIQAVFISKPEYMRAVFAQEGKHPIHVLPEAWTLYNEMYGCSRGLFFMDGEEWLSNRRIMNKLLLRGGVDYTWIKEACTISANDLVSELKAMYCTRSEGEVFAKETVCLEAKLYKWSLDTITCILLGERTYLDKQPSLQPILKRIAGKVNLVFETSAKLQFIPAKLAAKYEINAWRNFKTSVDEALTETNRLVERLLSDHPKNAGLLGMMLAEGMRKEVVVKIVVDLVLAAGDTTAYTMEWVLYLLAKNQREQEQLYQGIFNQNETIHSQENEIQENQQEKFYASLKLPTIKPTELDKTLLLKDFVKETLRLYPVAPFLTRVLPQPAKIGPYSIPKHTLVLYSLYTSGRDAEYFADSETFRPRRWRSRCANMAQASLPFAMGSRSCVGRKIAEFQLQIALGKVLEAFKVETNGCQDVGIVLKMVAVPDKPLDLKLTRRQSV